MGRIGIALFGRRPRELDDGARVVHDDDDQQHQSTLDGFGWRNNRSRHRKRQHFLIEGLVIARAELPVVC